MPIFKRFWLLPLVILLFCGFIQHGGTFEFNSEIDETPEGAETATIGDCRECFRLGVNRQQYLIQ